MKLFKKKEEPEQIKPPECRHKWRDFPWYIDSTYYTNGVQVAEVVEPYVCIHCKKRKDVTLDSYRWEHLKNYNQGCDLVSSVEETYSGKIKPRAEVEDMINDFQLVDREYLEIAASLFSGRGIL